MAKRKVRYQGAIVRQGEAGDEVLLIRHAHASDGRTYWLLPGGGIEDGESPEQCVLREMLEETGLTVVVERLLADVPSPGQWYEREHTYLCRVVAGDAAPGDEPEFAIERPYDIVEVGWFALAGDGGWVEAVQADEVTAGNLRRIRGALSRPTEDALDPEAAQCRE